MSSPVGVSEDDPGDGDSGDSPGGGGGDAPADSDPSAEPNVPHDGPLNDGGSDPVDPLGSATPSTGPGDEPLDDATDDPLADPSEDPTDGSTDDPSADATVDQPTHASSSGAGGDGTGGVIPGAVAVGSAQVSVEFSGTVGDLAAGLGVVARGAGLQPGSRVSLWLFSSPELLASGFAADDGSFAMSATLPESVPPGEHRLVLSGTDSQGQAIEQATGITITNDGHIAGISADVPVGNLVIPKLPENPRAPAYPPVQALDDPAAVVVTATAAVAVLAVAGAASGAGARSGGAGGGSGGAVADPLKEGLWGRSDAQVDADVSHNRGWRTRFRSTGSAWGDRSWLHRVPGTAFVDEASFVATRRIAPLSPLLSRVLADGAPLRAIVGSASLLLPLAAAALGIAAGIQGQGIAQPPVLALLIPLMVIGVIDSLAGLVGLLGFSAVVVALGGIVDASSVRTLMGVSMLVVGPGLVGASFRDLRRPGAIGFAALWEHLIDFVTVPLLGAWITVNVVSAIPPLGGAQFPIAEQGGVLALVVLASLLAKVALETLARRSFPERLATVAPGDAGPPAAQQRVISGLLRAATFLFISAAFIGNVWQLWVAGALVLIPLMLDPLAERRFANSPRLWQALPDGLLYFTLILAVLIGLGLLLGSTLGNTAQYAQMAFLVFLIPDFIMEMLALFGREPNHGDVRWFMRPSFTWLYRVGGVVVLLVAVWLAAPR